MANILFEYLYRDAGNYKQYWSVIFENAKGLSLQRLEDLIRAELRDGEWFLAEKVGLPLCFFNSPGEETDDDHPWHEFGQLVLPGNGLVLPVDDWRPAHDSRDILDLIREMRVWNQMGWESDKQPCCICKGAFTDADWEDRHDLHKKDCPRMRQQKTGLPQFTGEIGCDCNLVCHARCCPECNRSEVCPVCGEVPSEACKAHHDHLLEEGES